ncbi:MAG: sigma-70 family RNA polymerase sigma factor [Spirochaetia bacterium]|nr:sigma-70 family RNA polymerase sigma factor [Spirochaetia bacterium]
MQTAIAIKQSARGYQNAGDPLLAAYMRDIRSIPLLDRETEREVAEKAHGGDANARDLLVRSNLRFVASIAGKYFHPGLSRMDLVNEGNLGLMRAAETFDPSRGFHFITYAIWWIRQSISLAIREKASIIRIPVRAANLSQEDLHNLDCLSLDGFVAGEAFDFAGSVPDETQDTPESGVYSSDMRSEINRSLAQLSSRERKVVQLRFGLNGMEPCTLEKTSDRIGVSKERVRQIERTALRKIRMNSRQQLAAYLN